MKLPSGRELTVTVSDFATSKALYMAVVEEAKSLKLDSQDELNANFLKDIFCTALSSKKIEAALWACMERALIDKVHITQDSFEDVKHRADYFEVCFAVAQENVLPFTKGLSAKFKPLLERLKNGLGSGLKTTP